MAERQVRYAVIGLGWFSQVAVLPAFRNAGPTSKLVALCSGNADKRRELGDAYGVDARFGYDELDDRLASGDIDAVYIATPNHTHRDLAVRAARAGVHVLCEKPMAVTEDECEAMIDAAEEHGVKLMVAYRLHFEAANMRAVEIVRSGTIGDATLFDAVFGNQVNDEDNIRLGPVARGGGPLYDIGIYCINAARYIFQDEPEAVSACVANSDAPRFSETNAAAGAVMRFPGNRLATFTCSFAVADQDAYTVLGTRGHLRVEPAFGFQATLGHRLVVNGETTEETFEKRDQVAPEIITFTECILDGREPEPSGREGLADVRIIRALHLSAETGETVELAPFERRRRPGLDQEMHRPSPEKPKTVGVESPH